MLSEVSLLIDSNIFQYFVTVTVMDYSERPGSGEEVFFTSVVDGVRPQQVSDVMSPARPVLPVPRLQNDTGFGSRRLSDPNFKLQPIVPNALSQTHLTRLQGGDRGSGYCHWR